MDHSRQNFGAAYVPMSDNDGIEVNSRYIIIYNVIYICAVDIAFASRPVFRRTI